jgi:hypothetical protein
MLAALLATLTGRAQVTVEVVTEQDKFLPAEAMPVAVRVVNRSGRTLNLGDQPDWLTFDVEGRDGFVVEKTGEVPVLEPFKLESGEVVTRRADLAPYFSLNRPGGYRIEATVQLRELGGQVTSKAKNFDVIEGAILWTQEFGMPSSGGATNQPLEVRRYTLLKANYLKSELRLYFRVSDEANQKVIKIFPVGPMVSFSDPMRQLDKQNNLHLIYQSGRVACLYVMITPDGEILRRQTYEYAGSRPRLTADESGKITVAGGVRRPTPSDLPATTSEPSPAPK